MTALSYTAAGRNPAKAMKRVCDDHDPVVITRRNAESVLMLSLGNYEALCETSYLPQSPKNARRPIESIGELNAGRGKEREIVE